MDKYDLLSKLRAASQDIEHSFLELSTLFPELMRVQHNSSSKLLREELQSLSNDNHSMIEQEENFFGSRDSVYVPLLEKLNHEIESLGEVNVQVADIKHCSEDMELIALNAMVISIKSGEKGRAFSSITENLKRLSNEMIMYSGRLIDEEDILIKNINTLKEIFSAISEAQKSVAQQCFAGTSMLKTLLNGVGTPLEEIEAKAETVWPPISKAMEGIQLQDIIRQSLDQVIMCLNEILPVSDDMPDAQYMDTVSLNMELYQVAIEILRDIAKNLNESNRIFSTNWKLVTDILDAVDKQRLSYIDRFLQDGSSDKSLMSRINELVDLYQSMLDKFSESLVAQKDLVRTCQSITDKGRSMYLVFGDLRPVIGRLHHVRVLQQIEVAKNAAISAVKDSANDMDDLIMKSNRSLDTMQNLIEVFLNEIDQLLGSFSQEITSSNSVMASIRIKRSDFFAKLQSSRDDIVSIMQHFSVYPDGFSEKCQSVSVLLDKLIKNADVFGSVQSLLQKQTEECKGLYSAKLASMKLSSWEIQDDKFRSIINKFTITSHKKAAGKIAGIAIEGGVDSGDVTFF